MAGEASMHWICERVTGEASLTIYAILSQQASRCVQELEVPHFHHELVYEVSNELPVQL